MNYLVGENVFSFNSGTEFSQMQRLKAFKAANMPVKIVLRNYNRLLSQALKDNGIDQKDVINMYDYFQGTTDVPRKEQNLRLLKSIPLADYHINGIDSNHSLLQDQGRTIADIHVMPLTVGLIGDIEYHDDLGNKAVREYWDWRGFKSMVENYHPDGKVATQRYLRQDGSTAIEVTHMYINHQVLPTMWKLYNYYGHDYVFDTENQLFTFFLNELNTKEKGTFISDRRSLDDCVLNVADPVQTVSVVHSLTFNNFKHPAKAGLLPSYKLALNQGERHFDKVICATKDQVEDLTKVLGRHNNFMQAADCCADRIIKPRHLRNNIPRLIYRGMLGTNKKIGDVIRAFHRVRREYPKASLVIQGYFLGQKDRDNVSDLIKQFRLDDAVELLNYSIDHKAYTQATVYVNASDNEAFGIAMLESMAHGVPVVTYDIPYTAQNLVKDGVNGKLVTNKTPSELAKAIMSVLANDKIYHQLSDGAIKTAKHFSQKHLANEWQSVLDK